MSSLRIFKNFSSMAASQGVSMIAGLITVTVLARALGPENFGILGFCIAISSYLGLLTNFGMDSHGVREIAKDTDQTPLIAGIALTSRCVFAVLTCLVLVIGFQLAQPAPETRTVLLIQAVGFLFIALNLDFAYQGLQKMTFMAGRQIAAAIAVAAGTVVFVSEPTHLFIAAAIPVIANLASAIILLAHFRIKISAIKFRNSLSKHKDFVKRSAPVAIMAVFVTVQINIDIIMLGVLRPDFEVGLYAAASRLFAVVIIAANLLHNVYLPVFSEVGPGDSRPPAETATYAKLLGFGGGAILIGGTLLSGSVIEILFGAKFVAAESALVILMYSAVGFYFGQAYGTPLLAWQSDRAYLKVVVFAAVANLILNAVLIPRFGIEGAATATLLSQTAMFLVLVVVVRRAYQLAHGVLFMKIVGLAAVCAAPLVAVRLTYPEISPIATIAGGLALLLVFTWLCARAGILEIEKVRRIFAL